MQFTTEYKFSKATIIVTYCIPARPHYTSVHTGLLPSVSTGRVARELVASQTYT
jgi:hypothetical protein